jgi:hypothetical protein
MTPGRKLLVCSLLAGVLAPSFAHAQVVTYTFRLQEMENSSKATAQTAKQNEYAQLGIVGFLGTLANDVTAKKCNLAPNVLSLFSSVVLPILKGSAKAGFLAGDTTYADGTITMDLGKGVIDGGLLTTAGVSFQTTGTSTNVTNDYENLGSQSLLCGGPSNTSGPGTCGAVCTSAGPNCKEEGGAPVIASASSIGNGYVESFIYPLANSPETFSLCGGSPTLTWEECCNDPNLVIARHLHVTLSSDHTRIFGTGTDEEGASTFEGQQ